MLQPELRNISPNDYHDWAEFAAAEHPEPWNEFGAFVLDIGLEGEEGTTLFQVVAATPAAVQRAKANDKHARILVVDSFEPQVLKATLAEHVASQGAHTWEQIVDRLRRNMYWEYEKQWG